LVRGNCTQVQGGQDEAAGRGQVTFFGINAGFFGPAGGGGVAVGMYKTERGAYGSYFRKAAGAGRDFSAGTEGGASTNTDAFQGSSIGGCGGVNVVNGCASTNSSGTTISGGGSIGPTEITVSGHGEYSETFITRPKYPTVYKGPFDCSKPEQHPLTCSR
jgi:hypothetical protein